MHETSTETVVEGSRVTYRRHLDVPIDLAFEAWSSHEHLSQWWGPDGFTLATRSLNFSNGGHWDFIMRGPDGHEYRNKIEFIEIKRPHLIRYKHVGDGEGAKDVEFEARIHFEEVGDGTTLTLEQIFRTREELERVEEKYGAIEGGKQHVGKYGLYVEALQKGQEGIAAPHPDTLRPR